MFLILLFMLFLNKMNSQCTGNFTFYSCDNNITIASPGTANHYDWYEYSACTGLSSRTYHSTGSSFSTTYSNGTYCISYDALDSSNQILCSTDITVIVDNGFTITSSSFNVPSTFTLDLTGNKAYMNYSSFQWYKNGSAIGGANLSTYTTSTFGDFYVTASSTNCNNKTSNIITVYDACESSPQNIHSCSNNLNLSPSSISSTITYDWYVAEENITSYPITTVSSYSYYKSGSSVVFDKGDFSSNFGSFYIYYISKLGGNPICTSGVFSLIIDDIDPVISKSSNTPSSTLSHSIISGAQQLGYTNYQWYRNGQIIIGAGSSTYTATLPGDYYFIATSPYCGIKTSQIANIDCGSNTYSNYTFSTGTTNISNATLVLDGTISIPAGATLNINNSTIYMKSCSEILVKADHINSVGGVLNITNSDFSSCGQWAGIFVEGLSAANLAPNENGNLTLDGVTISDAKVAVYAFNNSYIDVRNCVFYNNNRHIQIDEFAGTGGVLGPSPQSISIINNQFKQLMQTNPSCSTTFNIASYAYSSIRPFVYLNNAQEFIFSDNVYTNGIITGNPQQYALIDYATSQLPIDIRLTNETIHSDFYTALKFENVGSVSIGGNVNGNTLIENVVQNGIEIINCSTSDLNTVVVTNSSSGKGQTGILIKQSNFDCYITSCIIDNFTIGIEYYDNDGDGGTFESNDIQNNTYGLLLAPECNPIGLNNNTCNSPNYAATRNISITCSKILNNDWGIVGVGDMIAQGQAIPDKEWETFFDYNSNSTTNTYADIAWYTPFVGGSPNRVIFHSLNNFHPIFGMNSSILLDGVSINNSNIIDYINYNSNGAAGNCRGTFKKDNSLTIKNKSEAKITIFPNPVLDKLYINNNFNIKGCIRIYDITGKEVKTFNIIHSEITELDIHELNSGCYFVKFENKEFDSTVYVSKLLKY